MSDGKPPSLQKKSRMRRWKLLVAAAIGVGGAAAALAFLPSLSGTAGPATLRMSVGPGSGETLIALPPLGEVSASTHTGPLDVRVTLDRVDFERLGPLATSPGGRAVLRSQVTRGLEGLARRTAALELAGAVIAALILAAAVFHRDVPALAVAGATALVSTVAAGALAASTYRVEAFEEPRYTGTLTRARQVVETVQRSQEVLDQARSRFEIATRRVSDLMTVLATEDGAEAPGDTVILHVSDIHANPIGLQVAAELAEEFDVDAVLDTGDLASAELDTGQLTRLTGPLDRALVREVSRIDAPYYFVAGNHDSPGIRATLRRAPNVTVVEGTVYIDGLEVLGWPDPTFATVPISGSEKAETRLRIGEEEVAPEVVATQPEVLAVHDPRLAEASAGSVPLVLAGHMHVREQEEVEGTLFLTVGSTGATGLKSLTVENELAYEAQILHFDGTSLAAVDYVTLRGLGNDFTLERTTFEDR